MGQFVEFCRGQHELPAGEEVVGALPFGYEAECPVDVGVLPDRGLVERDRPRGGGQEPAHHVDEGGLPGAVGAEQARDPRADGHGDPVDGDDIAVPPRHVLQLDRAQEVPAFRNQVYRIARAPATMAAQSSAAAGPASAEGGTSMVDVAPRSFAWTMSMRLKTLNSPAQPATS